MKIINVGKLGHGLQNQHAMRSLAQLQALQAWAMNMNIDISSPPNTHLIPQLLIRKRLYCSFTLGSILTFSKRRERNLDVLLIVFLSTIPPKMNMLGVILVQCL